jgi:hypothetical protein
MKDRFEGERRFIKMQRFRAGNKIKNCIYKYPVENEYGFELWLECKSDEQAEEVVKALNYYIDNHKVEEN